jgi:hypothetical protein
MIPTQFPFLFDGIDNAGSVYRGVIDIIWDFPMYGNGDIVDLDAVRYHILSYAGYYDFKSASAKDLVSEFELNSLNTTDVQYHLVDNGEVLEFTFNTTLYGEMHSILVIAEVNGVFSRNTEATSLYSSEADPVLKEGVNIVGIFVPTENLLIKVSDDSKVLEFDGPVRQEHKDLVMGDYVLGLSTSLEIFCLLVTSVVESSDMRVVLNTEAAKVEDVYDAFDFEVSFGMSRPDKVEANQLSRYKHRHLLERRALFQRKLGWFDSAINWLKGGIEKGINWIGDTLVEPVAVSDLSCQFQ